ncbi:MAG: hypothetical protein SVV80_07395 [Planctomycetota bacterium]|nr:hypothetical protein [Planctomycetota bacterium]
MIAPPKPDGSEIKMGLNVCGPPVEAPIMITFVAPTALCPTFFGVLGLAAMRDLIFRVSSLAAAFTSLTS